MNWIKNALSSDSERELLLSTSRSIIFVVAAIYTALHFVATLAWPDLFSPSLWAITLLMMVIISLSIRLLDEHYIWANAVWFMGLTAAIFLGYAIYQQPEILLLLIVLPLMAIITIGAIGTGLVVVFIIITLLLSPSFLTIPAIPTGYRFSVILGSIFATLLGWGLSINLFTAIDSSSFHFQEARKHLKEARRHRAEVSRMLKELNQTNYQLEHLNQMLNAARKRAEEARSDRDRFILSVSHELRSPLNFIIGFSDLMVNSPETYAALDDWPAGLYDDAKEIYRSSMHLMQLIDDILDMGQIDVRQMTLFRERIQLDQVVMEAYKMVEAAFIHKKLNLSIDISPDLPEVFIDSIRIRQVLLNLLNNSLRFTECGGVKLSVRPQGDSILVCVADTGPGIAPEDIPKVFDEFRQVGLDSWRRREGTGLGLSISRRFVQLHGGKMWLESEVGQGTSFFFSLPVLESLDELDENTIAAIAGAERSTPKGFFSRRLGAFRQVIFVISPDTVAADIVSHWLDDYKVIAINDPAQLLSQVAQNLPQAILIDKVLIDEDQIHIQELPYDIPVISIIFPSIRGRYPLLPQGVADYLIKPVTRKSLLDAIQSLDLAHRKVLLVDDDPAMLRYVQQTITAANKQAFDFSGLEILTAYTGFEALELYQNNTIGAILLDLDLPDISGWQVLEQIKSQPDPPPIIIVSAHDMPQTLLDNEQVIFSLQMRRALSQQELPKLLQVLLKEVPPSYPVSNNLDP